MSTKLNLNSLLDDGGAYEDAINGWGGLEEVVPLGHKIRVTFNGLAPKTGYAYKQEGAWLGIRYTWRTRRWYSLLNYNNPLVKLELGEINQDGKTYTYKTLWEKEQKWKQ
jgi:hypothetical protein